MPRYSDVLTGKNSPSNPVPYEQALDSMSLEAMKAIAVGNWKWYNELVYRLSFLYRKSAEKVVDDMVVRIEAELKKLGLEADVKV